MGHRWRLSRRAYAAVLHGPCDDEVPEERERGVRCQASDGSLERVRMHVQTW